MTAGDRQQEETEIKVPIFDRETRQTLRERITAVKNHNRISWAMLADLIALSSATLSRFASGQEISVRNIKKISDWIRSTQMEMEQSDVVAGRDGTVRITNHAVAINSLGTPVVMSRDCEIELTDGKDRELARFRLPYGAHLLVDEGQKVVRGQRLAEWDPYSLPIVTERAGKVQYIDLLDDITLVERMDEDTGLASKVVVYYKQHSRGIDLRPRLQLKDEHGEVTRLPNGSDAYFLAPDSILLVGNGAIVAAGDVLARIPRDITNRLPRAADSPTRHHPSLPPDPPKLGPASVFVVTPRGYEISPQPPESAEREDPTQKILHGRLLHRVERLQGAMVRVANTHPTLAAEFSDYAAIAKTNLNQMDVPGLWSVGNGIQEFVHAFEGESSGVMSEPLEPEVLADLRALVLDHTAFVMGFATGQALTERVRALRDAGRSPAEIATAANAVLRGMLLPPRLLADTARRLVKSISRALDEVGYDALPLITSGYETGKNGLIGMGRTLHPLLILVGAADVAQMLAGDAQADTLRTAIIYFRDNASAIAAFAVSDPQMTEWLAWLTVRAKQFLREFNDGL